MNFYNLQSLERNYNELKSKDSALKEALSETNSQEEIKATSINKQLNGQNKRIRKIEIKQSCLDTIFQHQIAK
jgi:DNA-binding protein YbaB